jgi:hypothetical protein
MRLRLSDTQRRIVRSMERNGAIALWDGRDRESAQALVRQGLVQRTPTTLWELTEAGVEALAVERASVEGLAGWLCSGCGRFWTSEAEVPQTFHSCGGRPVRQEAQLRPMTTASPAEVEAAERAELALQAAIRSIQEGGLA